MECKKTKLLHLCCITSVNVKLLLLQDKSTVMDEGK